MNTTKMPERIKRKLKTIKMDPLWPHMIQVLVLMWSFNLAETTNYAFPQPIDSPSHNSNFIPSAKYNYVVSTAFTFPSSSPVLKKSYMSAYGLKNPKLF